MNKLLFVISFTFIFLAQAPSINDLSLDQKVGQLFMIDVRSKFMTVHDDDYKNAMWAINKYNIGGFILFSGHTLATAHQLNEFQKRSKIPLLISTDLERGFFQNFPDGVQFPPNMAISATNNSDFAYHQGRITAEEAKSVGIHMILAPVLDINNNPKNPIINFRSYGATADVVSEYGARFIQGVQDANLIATAKHFPGHGDTSEDSHESLPEIEIDFDRLNSVELKPFKTAIDSGLKAVMTGHLALPLLHKGKNTPATTSKLILDKVLRKQLGFDGLIISDAFNMDAISEESSIESAMIDAINAGVDIILMPKELGKAYSTIKKAVNSGSISMATLNTRVQRILDHKKELGLFNKKVVDLNNVKKVLEHPNSILLSEKIANNSISLIKGNKSDIDFKPDDKILNITVSSEESLENPGRTFFKELKSYYPNSERLIVDHRTTQTQIKALKQKTSTFKHIIVSVFSRTKANKTTVGIDSLQQSFLKKILDRKKAVIVTFGNPFITSDFKYIQTHIAAYSYSILMQKAAARALGKQFKITGQIKTEIPKITKSGRDFTKLDSFLKNSVEDSVFPGVSVVVGTSQSIFYQKSFGNFTYNPNSKKVQKNTLYDLASLTKVLGTSLAIMKLIDEDELHLNTKLSDIFDNIKDKKKRQITIGQLLTHTSGMLWHKRFYEENVTSQTILEKILQEPLISEPGKKTKYSDLGFITLMKVVEHITEEPFQDFLAEEIYNELDVQTLLFNPSSTLQPHIPPTEKGFYHKELAQGIVHDGNAASIGGISGHAGLFGNTEAIAKIAQLMLNEGIYKGDEILSRKVIRKFNSKANTDTSSPRGFGWDKPSPISSAGKYLSDRTYGHLGFTGTSLWIDPKYNIFICVLSNRVYPTRDNKKIRKFRPKFHNLVMELMGVTKYRDSYKEKLKTIDFYK